MHPFDAAFIIVGVKLDPDGTPKQGGSPEKCIGKPLGTCWMKKMTCPGKELEIAIGEKDRL